MAGGLGAVLAVQDEEPAVPGRQAEDHVAGEGDVGGDNRADQAATAARRELDHLRRVPIADDGADRAERLHLMRLGAVRVGGLEQ